MNATDYTGMFLWEVREALYLEGITEYNVVVTGPPRLSDRTVDNNLRVILIYPDKSPVMVLVCRT